MKVRLPLFFLSLFTLSFFRTLVSLYFLPITSPPSLSSFSVKVWEYEVDTFVYSVDSK